MDLYVKADLVKMLSFFYRTMLASEALLSRAIIGAETNELMQYYIKHRNEEEGHDEILLDDLNRLGIDEPATFHYAAQFAGSQYYLIEHDHTAMLLGYMRAMESDSLPLEEIDKLEAHHGTALTCLRHHALHDPDHKRDLDAMIDLLDPQLKDRVIWNEQNIRRMLMEARI